MFLFVCFLCVVFFVLLVYHHLLLIRETYSSEHFFSIIALVAYFTYITKIIVQLLIVTN